MSTCEKEQRDMAKLDRAEESEQIKDDDLPELVTDSEDTDLEDNKLLELGTGNEANKPKPTPRRPARPRRQLKPRELKLPELPHRQAAGKPPIPEGSDKKPRRRFTQGTVTPREVPKYHFRPISPVHPSAPAAVDQF